MTELDQPTAVRRRRFRFGLRTLLAVVTVAAVGSWGIGWGGRGGRIYKSRILGVLPKQIPLNHPPYRADIAWTLPVREDVFVCIGTAEIFGRTCRLLGPFGRLTAEPFGTPPRFTSGFSYRKVSAQIQQ